MSREVSARGRPNARTGDGTRIADRTCAGRVRKPFGAEFRRESMEDLMRIGPGKAEPVDDTR
jgi:hypothetical protein